MHISVGSVHEHHLHIAETHLGVITSSPYSPDLIPSHFHMFFPLREFLKAQRFRCDLCGLIMTEKELLVKHLDECIGEAKNIDI